MDAIFEALASAARRRILFYLADDDLTAGEIASRFDMSKPAISKHLQLLESAGLVGSRKRGQFVHYWLVREGVVATLGGFLQRISARVEEPTPVPVPAAEAAPHDDQSTAREIFAEQLRRAKEVYGLALAGRGEEAAA